MTKVRPVTKIRLVGSRGLARGLVGRRGLAYTVLVCVVGAGLVLYVAARTWSVEVTDRPAPLPDLRTAHDGPGWLSPIAVVAFAAAGAVVATRGAVRRTVGILLGVMGAGLVAGGGHGLAAGQGVGRVWAALCVVGGLAVALAGALTVAYGRRWPAMGTRYERRAGRRQTTSDRPIPAVRDGSVASAQAWDALDRGEDPTLR